MTDLDQLEAALFAATQGGRSLVVKQEGGAMHIYLSNGVKYATTAYPLGRNDFYSRLVDTIAEYDALPDTKPSKVLLP